MAYNTKAIKTDINAKPIRSITTLYRRVRGVAGDRRGGQAGVYGLTDSRFLSQIISWQSGRQSWRRNSKRYGYY